MSAPEGKLRLLLVTHFYSTHRSGIEIAAHRIAESLCRDCGSEIDWIASGCDPVPANLPDGLRCIPAGAWNGIEQWSGLPCPLWSPAAIFRLWRAVRDCNAVHLHDSLYMGNLVAYLFARLQRKPVVVTQHIGAIPYDGWFARKLLSLLNRSVVRTVLSGADRVVFYNPVVQAYFREFCNFRVSPAFVQNGVDTAIFGYTDAARAARLRQLAGRDPLRPLVVFAGRFVARKGIGILLAMARALPDVGWIVAGDGPMRPEDACLPNVTVLRGRSYPEFAALYQMADLLVLPSKGEGFPLVVQEAMACGTPALVGSETAAGCPALGGLLLSEDVMVQEAPANWCRRVSALLGDIEALHRMRSEVARAAREQWSWPAAAQAYAAVFRELRLQ